MKTRQIFSLLTLSVLVIAAPRTIFGQTAAPPRDSTIRVGVILPLSGDAASTGEACRNGMKMAYQKLPADAQKRIKLIFEDDALSLRNAVAAFQKLMAVDKIDVLVTVYSGCSKAVAPLAEENKIPQLAIASDPDVVRGRKYVMNFWTPPQEEVKVALPEAVRRGYKRIARITTVQQGLLAIKSAFDCDNRGQISIVLDEEYIGDARDFRPFLTKVRRLKDLDAILVLLINGQAGLFAKQAREMGVKLPLFNFEVFEDAQEQALAEGALVGHWYVNADDPSDAFLREYAREFPGASFFGAGNSHDAVLLLSAAIEQDASREGINSFLHNVKDFSGVMGVYSATPDNRFTLPAAIKVVTQQGFIKLSR